MKNTITNNLILFVLAVAGYLLYSQHLEFTYLSNDHVSFLMLSKIWSLGFILFSLIYLYFKKDSKRFHWDLLILLSTYFVILYGILFIGTEYGMHGQWGDNGNRFAYLCKMIAYDTIFTDWYYKDLPGFYPPLWFYLMSLYAKVLSLEAYQTVKFGYLLTYLLYPWLLYYMWQKVTTKKIAAAISFVTIFIAYKYLDWIYYEHITAAIFIPWWLYYFENDDLSLSIKSNWKFYLSGGIIGGLIFMTYYYWFFIAVVAILISIVLKLLDKKPFSEITRSLLNKFYLGVVIIVVSSVYWLPLVKSIFRYGSESSQNVWFGMHHADLTSLWNITSVESLLILGGIFFTFYLFKDEKYRKFMIWFIACLVMIIIDRIFNLSESSIQSRKILEFLHVFAAAPLVIGLFDLIKNREFNPNIRKGFVGLFVLLILILSNAHTEIEPSNFYKNAVNQRVPQNDLEVFSSVETHNKVFLTTHYLEACYLPYYMFITYNNMSSHTAGRYLEREKFIEEIAKIEDPEILAYLLAYNKFDKVDYIYLPFDSTQMKFQMILYQVSFNDPAGKVKKIPLECRYDLPNDYFVLINERGLFEVSSSSITENKNESLDEFLIKSLE